MSRIPITYFPPHVLTIKTPSEWVVQEGGTCIHNFHHLSMYFDCSSYILENKFPRIRNHEKN